MQPSLLSSIVELTRSRSTDTLEVSLLMTITEIIKCHDVQLFSSLSSGDPMQVDLLLGLHHDIDSGTMRWIRPNAAPLFSDTVTMACRQRSVLRNKVNESELICIPFDVTENQVNCLMIYAHSLSKEQTLMVDALVQIYVNYSALIEQSEKDKLTGLLNRSSLERRYNVLVEKQVQIQKQHHKVSDSRHLSNNDCTWLALIDIDHFKQINDVFGHLCGDEVLLRLSQYMTGMFRKSDLLFRYGGEEFLVILEPIGFDAAMQKLDAFRDFVSHADFPLIEQLTVSIGFTSVSVEEYYQSAIERADRALYFAKDNGRNAVFNFEQLAQQGHFRHATSKGGEVDLF